MNSNNYTAKNIETLNNHGFSERKTVGVCVCGWFWKKTSVSREHLKYVQIHSSIPNSTKIKLQGINSNFLLHNFYRERIEISF